MRESRAKVAALATGLLVVAAVVLFAVLQQRPGTAVTAPAEREAHETTDQERAAAETAEAEDAAADTLGERASPDTLETTGAERLALGQRVYRENRCARCHSIAGEGGRRSPLDGVGDYLTREEIRLWIVDPQEMAPGVRKPSYDHLPPEEIEALVEYMASLTDEER